MRAYLDGMAAAPCAVRGADLPIVLAALGPRMLELAGERTRGAHPYFAPPSNTARSRRLLGERAWLCPEQKLLLERDAGKARARALAAMAGSLALPNYRRNLMRAGFAERELDGGGSDRVVDALVAWGDIDALVARSRTPRRRCGSRVHRAGSRAPDAAGSRAAQQLAPQLVGAVRG
jgi:probable F420-dependent oxidoreductase